MEVRVQTIENDEDLTNALRRISDIFDAEAGTPKDAELDVLTYLVERYERERYPLPQSTPQEILKFMMEQNGRKQSDLAKLLGSRSRASEILNGKRDLTLNNIKLLVREWHIPAQALLGDLVPA